MALLRQAGWDAYGVEIDPTQAELARVGLRTIGHDPRSILDVSPNGLIDASDERFDFLFSEQVIEHVEDLRSFVIETWRVLKPGGSAFHVFPSRWRLLEPHIRQPIVHWLPKGRIQSVAVRLWVTLGVESGSVRQDGQERGDLGSRSQHERANAYTTYLRERTYYRSQTRIEQAFLQCFASVDLHVIGEIIGEIRGLSTLNRLPLLGRLLRGLCVHFYSSAIFLSRSSSQ